MNNIKISIIVPVYNSEQYLIECINSIRNQTFSNLEIIIIDDGSSDESPKIIDEYRKIDNRIIPIYQANAGVSAARNAGLERVTGDYVGFVDSDDFCEPNMFEELLKAIITESADVAVCSFAGHEKNIADASSFYTGEQAIIEINRASLFEGHLHNKLIKSGLIKNIRLNENVAIMEDLLFLHDVFFCADKVVFINKGLYHYNDNPESVMHNISFKKSYLTRLDASHEIISFFREHMPKDIYWAYRTTFISDFVIVRKISRSLNKHEFKSELNQCVDEYKRLYDRSFFESESKGNKLLYKALKVGYLPYRTVEFLINSKFLSRCYKVVKKIM